MRRGSTVDDESPCASVTFSTAYRRTLDSEHCTHGIHNLVNRTLAAQAVPHVISSLGCPRR